MNRRHCFLRLVRTVAVACSTALTLASPQAQAQTPKWPEKVVRIIAAGPAGGSADIMKALAQPGARERLQQVGFETPQPRTPDELTASLKTDHERVGAVLKSIGFKPE